RPESPGDVPAPRQIETVVHRRSSRTARHEHRPDRHDRRAVLHARGDQENRLMRVRLPYPLLCTLIGLAIGWLPMLFHGPIPYKFDIHYIRGSVAVWDWYLSRAMIGFFVGITVWPRLWWMRGPLMGVLLMLPPCMVSLATPECGPPCMF